MLNNLVFLRKKIVDAAKEYYSGNPIITDAEFDSLVEDLKSLSPEDELLSTIGWGYKPADSELNTVDHLFVMKRGLSKETLESGDNKVKEGYYTPKYDGSSVTIYYDNDGNYIKAVTRGDGVKGTDVTDKLRYFVPLKVSDSIAVVTGEWICSKESLNKNYPMSISHRNIANGVLMRKSYNLSELLNFSFVAYRINAFHKFNGKINDYIDIVNCLNNNGFLTTKVIKNDINDLTYNDIMAKEFYNYDHNGNGTFNYDGIVISSKISFHLERSELLNKDHVEEVIYEDEMAYKLNTDFKKTKVTDIQWRHTRTGRFVPTIVYEPIELSGAMCSRVSGNNAKFILDNGIGIGSELLMVRSGEVIPHIERVVSRTDPRLPIVCPDCGNDLMLDGVDLVCSNEECGNVKKQRLYNYIAVVGETKGVSSNLINALIDLTGWEDIPDIYRSIVETDFNEIKYLGNFGDASVNLLKIVYNKLIKGYDKQRWIVGLSLDGIGWTMAGVIKDKLFESLISGNIQNFTEIKGVGNSIQSVIEDNFDFIKTVYTLSKYGFCEDNVKQNTVDESLIKVCITGKLESGLKKKELYELYKDKIVESDVNNCDILICNKEGSSKYNKAVKLGKRIFTESEFVEEFCK